jgi:putative membrane protein
MDTRPDDALKLGGKHMFWINGFRLGGMMLFGGLFMLLFWGGVIALIILAVWALTRFSGGKSGGWVGSTGQVSNRALEILKERYARGELTREQFDTMRRDLTTESAPTGGVAAPAHDG